MEALRLILSQRKYFAPAWVFMSLNILVGTWALYLPHVKVSLGLNDAQVGMALFSLALGNLLSIPFVPILNKWIGVGRSTQIGVVMLALAYNLPLLATGYYYLCAALMITGMCSAVMGISMNALVAIVERESQKKFMTAVHGFFSLGGFVGAGIGSVLLGWIGHPVAHMMGVSLVILITNLILSLSYQGIVEPQTEKGAAQSKSGKLGPLAGLAGLAFIIMYNEGAVEHWSNLYLFDVVGVTAGQAGLGFIVFSACMTLGRFLGDRIGQKVGSVNMIIYGCMIAFVGTICVIASGLVISVIGFGIIGIGLSVVVPEMFRLAANTPGTSASRGISIVSGVGFGGFLVGPVWMGLISDLTNLHTSYMFLSASILIALLLAQFRLKTKYVARH